MKILVTGGTGFLGRHLVWHAAAQGADVCFTGRYAQAAATVQRLAPAPVRWQPLSHGAAGATQALRHAAEGADVLIHCAALSAPWGREEDFQRANVASTAEVLLACQTCKVPRLVHVSTPSVYFGFADRLGIREDAPLPAPANAYVRTKRLAETLVMQAHLPEVAILRPRALYGPWDQTLMPRLLRVMARGPLPLMRGGHALLDLTYIDNAVDAAWRAATLPLPSPLRIYNVSNGEPRELGDILHTMARAFGLPLRTRKLPWPLVSLLARSLEGAARLRGNTHEPLLTRYSAGVLAFSQTLDVSALRQELGWQPRVSIDDGIYRHAHWWQTQQGLAL